ncbi:MULTISPECIES: hypothetical protein [Streptomyces]|uniref:hypothetical protein n=1 Tax=Streptomyces TaxID=1883 RepID=UPI000A58F063|nr:MULTISPECIES: hypothetical protein [Streptomyces]
MSSGAWAGAAVATITAAYALGSRRLSTTPISSAMVFVGAGILIGPAVLDVIIGAGWLLAWPLLPG